MDTALANLCKYVAVLAKSADETTRAEDRSTYTKHLEAAARLFVAAYLDRSAELEELVAGERHAFGWGYLSGPPGKAAEHAFDEFAKTVESKHAA